jgi:hypothetical protein
MESQLTKRIKSFTWRLGIALLVFGTEWISANAGMLDLSPAVTGILALMAGEVSKYLNTNTVALQEQN